MNPQYLFRGKKISDKSWIEGSLIQWPNGRAEIAVHGAKPGSLVKYAVIPETVGMWSTRKDKAGYLIFSGDIMGIFYDEPHAPSGRDAVNVAIVFQDGAFGWIGEVTGQFHPFADHALEDYTVCGNIHDNPELINK